SAALASAGSENDSSFIYAKWWAWSAPVIHRNALDPPRAHCDEPHLGIHPRVAGLASGNLLIDFSGFPTRRVVCSANDVFHVGSYEGIGVVDQGSVAAQDFVDCRHIGAFALS